MFNFKKSSVFLHICCITLGFCLLIADENMLSRLLCVGVGVAISLHSSLDILSRYRFENESKSHTRVQVFQLFFGIFIIFCQINSVIFLLGLTMLAYVIFVITAKKYPHQQFKDQLPKIVCALALLLSTNAVLVTVLARFLGVLLVAVASFSLYYKKSCQK